MNNPFTITFGKNPNLSIDRPNEKQEVIDAFTSDPINQQIFLITSIRGSGKTVLMTEISEYLSSLKDWICIELNPEIDMLESLLSKLNSEAGPLIKSLNLNLTFFNVVTIGASLENQITNAETAIIKILEHLSKQGKRVLLTIDEATNSKNLKAFASTFQILVRRNLPVFLLMTGLYENIRNLQNEKTLTFLYRAPRLELGPLNLLEIERKYKAVFSLTDHQAREMAVLTKGYAFAFQALGFLTCKQNGDYKKAMDSYRFYLEEYSYAKIWSELSGQDKKIAYGIAKAESRKTSSVLLSCGIDSNHFNPYRKRLSDKGIIDGNDRGFIKFTLPLFGDFVIAKYEMDAE